jgi:hypothetical protein
LDEDENENDNEDEDKVKDEDEDNDEDEDENEEINGIEELNFEEIASYETSPPTNEDAIKLINVSLDEMEVPNEETEEETQETTSIEDLTPSLIQVEKIEDEEQENLEEEPSQGEISQKESSKDVYRKMSLQSLKTLVITKGLCSDPSKLKKNDLLKMLETEDE